MSFCTSGTSAAPISTPRSPRATMTRVADASTIASRCSSASPFSILAMTRARDPAASIRSRRPATSSARAHERQRDVVGAVRERERRGRRCPSRSATGSAAWVPGQVHPLARRDERRRPRRGSRRAPPLDVRHPQPAPCRRRSASLRPARRRRRARRTSPRARPARPSPGAASTSVSPGVDRCAARRARRSGSSAPAGRRSPPAAGRSAPARGARPAIAARCDVVVPVGEVEPGGVHARPRQLLDHLRVGGAGPIVQTILVRRGRGPAHRAGAARPGRRTPSRPG